MCRVGMVLKSFDSGKLFGRVFGAGPPRVLALHGWGRSGSDFELALRDLDAIALDLPGFGASPPPAGSMSAYGYADAISPIMEEFSEPPLVIGHSFGGRVGTVLASEYPSFVGELLLTGVPLLRLQPPGRPRMAYRVLRWANRKRVISDAAMEKVRSRSGSADYRAASGVMREVLVATVNETYESILDSVRCPVTLMWGDQDTEAPLEIAQLAEKVLPDATLVVLQGIGHMVPQEAPEQLRALVEERLG